MKKLNYTLLLFLLPIFSFAQMQTKSIAIFKNGQSFVMKSGKVATPQGNYVMRENLPNALFGTLWFDAPNTEITSIASYQDSVMTMQKKDIESQANLLERNIGKEVKISVRTQSENNSSTYQGVLERVYTLAQNQSIIVLKGKSEWYSIKESEVLNVAFSDAPNYGDFEKSEMKPVIELEFENKAAAQDLEMMYLQNGLKWVPQYLLSLESENKGILTMQAEIANDVEDINNVAVDFVVGVPNFKYATQNALLVDFLSQIATFQNRQPVLQNSFSNAVIGYGVEAPPTASISDAESVEGNQNEDLFFYTVPNLTLPKGGRAVKTLFEEKVKIAHLYESSLTANSEYRRDYATASLLEISPQNPVYHVVKLENTTNQPWTSAPILVMNEQGRTRPISQDLMKFTASGSNAFIKLTETPEIRITHSEKLIDTKENIKKWRGHNYSLYKIKGEITVQSYKKKTLDVNIRRQITGTLLKSDKDWLKAEIVNLDTPNEKTNICWELKIGGKGETTIEYEYEIYIWR